MAGTQKTTNKPVPDNQGGHYSPQQLAGFKSRWRRLVDRFESRAIVPFVGAGISMQAKCLDDGDFNPSVWWLQGQLARSLVEEAVTGVTDPGRRVENLRLLHGQLGFPSRVALPPLEGYEGPPSKPGKKGSDEKVVLAADNVETLMTSCPEVRFERMAEVHSWWCGLRATCEAIKIGSFAIMSTLPAHRWMARLAREGLIREIISTNYDTCLETAYRHTFPSARQSDGDLPVVIRTLDEYRERGASRDDTEGCPIPRLYKINGCAAQYKEKVGGLSKEVRPAPSQQRVIDGIILTERQLHDFQKQEWKQELFRDRSRSRSLLFSGFGSDEPQVRHTLLQLAHEFGVGRDTEMELAEQCWQRMNAPFVAGYGATLAYPQSQVLREYALQHARDPIGQTRADLVDSWTANVFTGRDEGFFRAEHLESAPKDPDISGTISADLFWQRLYQSAFIRLVKHHSRRGSPFYGWLTDYTHAPQQAVEQLLTWLGGDDEDRPWGRCPWLVEELSKEGAVISRFSRWMMALRGKPPKWLNEEGKVDESRCPHDFERDCYLSLREDPLLALALLYVLMLLIGGEFADEKILSKESVDPGPEGLWVNLSGDPELMVVLTVNGVQPSRWLNQEPLTAGCVRQLVIPSLESGSLRDALHGTTQTGGARAIPIYRLSAGSLIERYLADPDEDISVWLRKVSAESHEPRRSDSVRLRKTDDQPGSST